jgi:lysophospholipase L1-like esterase
MHYNLDSIVYGVGGGVFDANTLDYYGDDFKPEVITVAYGTNDWARNYSEQRIRDNMKAFLDKLIGYYPDAQIIGISPIWRKDTEKGFSLSFEQAREVIADVYGEYGITCIDGYTLVSHENSKYADDVHPNMEGFMEYGENLIKELDLILAK